MSEPRRAPTSPYLLRRLRSYEEARADREATARPAGAGATADGSATSAAAGADRPSAPGAVESPETPGERGPRG
jgi:hypothetical protein